jgi:hypothetical protein
MRKITKEASNAFWGRSNYNNSNTSVVCIGNEVQMWLHGNKIATLNNNNVLTIASCGWETNTTKERLNGILSDIGMYIVQKKFKWYICKHNVLDSVEFKENMKVYV